MEAHTTPTKECPECGETMWLEDDGNFPECVQYFFECKCGNTEEED